MSSRRPISWKSRKKRKRISSRKIRITSELLTCPEKLQENRGLFGHGCGPKAVRFFSSASFNSGKIGANRRSVLEKADRNRRDHVRRSEPRSGFEALKFSRPFDMTGYSGGHNLIEPILAFVIGGLSRNDTQCVERLPVTGSPHPFDIVGIVGEHVGAFHGGQAE